MHFSRCRLHMKGKKQFVSNDFISSLAFIYNVYYNATIYQLTTDH